MDKTDENSKAFKFGKDLGKFFVSLVIVFVFAIPIWIVWNGALCDIFPLFNRITYVQSAGLCTVVWCLGRVWKGAPDGDK